MLCDSLHYPSHSNTAALQHHLTLTAQILAPDNDKKVNYAFASAVLSVRLTI